MMKSKKNTYRFWHSPLALFLLFIVLIFFGYKIIYLIEKQRDTAHKKELLQNEISNLLTKESSLKRDISKLETDEGKEEIIRSKYQLIKDGEKMVTIVDEDNKNDAVSETGLENHGFWNWIKRIFTK